MTIRPTVSLVDAESYFASRLRSETWNAADESLKTKALTQASFLVSSAFVFYDGAYEEISGGEIVWDERVGAAICEEAAWLLDHDPASIPEALFNGISSASAGSVSATFDKSFVCPWICEQTKILVGDLGTFIGADSDSLVKSTLLAM